MEGGRNAELCANKNNYGGQTWISIYVSPLSESPGKLLNRVVPNGTLRGVEGEGKISPIRFCPVPTHLEAGFGGDWINHSATPPTASEKPRYTGLFKSLNA